jgi:flagellar hook assembly protein FlgD
MAADSIGENGKYVETLTPVNLEMTESNVYGYPNPSSGPMTFRFPMAEAVDVQIRISDINGKLVWNTALPGRSMSIGINKAIWDGKNGAGQEASNGVYLLEISAGNQSVRKRIAILR